MTEIKVRTAGGNSARGFTEPALALIPTVVIYFVCQRYFERGINVTDVN
jgi:ABC-type glycerol-3-phosphate transport system permease component